MITPDSTPETVSVLGVNVLAFASYNQAVEYVATRIETGQKTFCAAINPEKVQRALHDPALMAVLARADMGICDGIGIALAARWLHRRTLRRCTGVDLFLALMARGARMRWRIFLLGASADSNEGACMHLRSRYPGLTIAGRQDGFFRDSAAVVETINAARPDLLFVAMGSPRQEFWIDEHRDRIRAPFCMGVGGTFDVLSGRARRAPAIFRKTGTEFLFRLLADPRRLRRQTALPRFLVSVLKARSERGHGRSGDPTRPRPGTADDAKEVRDV